jgi:glucose/arabinose dehydrogenase
MAWMNALRHAEIAQRVAGKWPAPSTKRESGSLVMYPRRLLFIVAAIALTACGEEARLPIAAGVGAHPQLPPPNPTLIPTVNIAPAIGWPVNGKPEAAPGMVVNAFAGELNHPRWLYVLPNGDVLVAETNAPPRPEDGTGIKGWFMKWAMNKVGAGVPSANRITLLRDIDGDGLAETRTVFLEWLNSPFGMALVGNDFYVANTDALVRFPYRQGETKITHAGTKVLDLPAGPINHHWTKNLLASRDGSRLYVTVGSNSNAAENGMDQEVGRAAIWEVDPKRGSYRIYASGLRNPNGLAWEPDSGTLWTVVNERDEIGSDLVPDYLTSVPDGSFFGWPYSYFGLHLDERVQPQRPDLVAKARVPDYALGPHTASLGLAFSKVAQWPAPFDNGVFIGQHGSWNRKPRSGYRVIFVPFRAGKPFGDPIDVLTGFVSADGDAFGRPVGVALDKRAALLVADDVGNIIWRVTAPTKTPSSTRIPPAEH